jgi:protein-ribulosamine 3-kinase
MLNINDAVAVSGGCIHRCYRATIDGETRFLKVNDAAFARTFAAEAAGLRALRAAGCRVPQPAAHGVEAGHAYLAMEWLELDSRGDFAALGRMLAQLHRNEGARFGWDEDNFIGATPQKNGWYESWAQFWRERRLAPQLELARINGFHIVPVNVERWLEDHQPTPSLLHGDLWSGNAGFLATGANAGSPVLFDPAVYYGDREADLAMTELFGGFPREFYSAYREAWPLDAGYEKRKHLYNLYHLLNHLNLFGGSYLGQVDKTLGLLAR